ncbi:carbohydrate ABC transporter membrane protein 2, CUT1 family [Friedmanniella luteola]|uniref:Carbohydrate ABC transporter membrane protein 2, CUT1 family n=1 Tax=Friedmanniella luteola TaxID=546871 RepID=A0A1H1L1Z9_9ACTN|nr:carbohydrate ABC transporter permease [Friedmanniella luteola]SDR68320.1 carbohydrate ABC transporter membrane protein 2, CUT1 family [Friedmanniella luteola]
MTTTTLPAVAAPAPVATSRPRRVRLTGRLVASLLLLLIAAAFIVPLLWVLLAAVNGDPGQGIRISWPSPFTLDNFRAVMTPETTYIPLLNGAVLCIGGTVVTMVCATLAAYPLSRYRSRLKRPFLVTILFSTGLPITAIMVPVYGLFVQLALDDSVLATMVFMATTALPISIWLTKNFMDGVPLELEEAAWTDGATPMQGLRRIIMPLMAPGLSVVAIYTFIGLWGNFFVPFILLLSPEKQPMSVTIYTFFGQYGQVVYGQLAAYALLYSLPSVLLYLVLNRRLGGAFAFGGGVKG